MAWLWFALAWLGKFACSWLLQTNACSRNADTSFGHILWFLLALLYHRALLHQRHQPIVPLYLAILSPLWHVTEYGILWYPVVQNQNSFAKVQPFAPTSRAHWQPRFGSASWSGACDAWHILAHPIFRCFYGFHCNMGQIELCLRANFLGCLTITQQDPGFFHWCSAPTLKESWSCLLSEEGMVWMRQMVSESLGQGKVSQHCKHCKHETFRTVIETQRDTMLSVEMHGNAWKCMEMRIFILCHDVWRSGCLAASPLHWEQLSRSWQIAAQRTTQQEKAVWIPRFWYKISSPSLMKSLRFAIGSIWIMHMLSEM